MFISDLLEVIPPSPVVLLPGCPDHLALALPPPVHPPAGDVHTAKCLQNVYKMYTKCVQNLYKMYTKCIQNVNKMYTKCLQNLYKMYT